MSKEKTTLPFLINPQQRIVKSETKKVYDLLTNIPTNITIKRFNTTRSKISL